MNKKIIFGIFAILSISVVYAAGVGLFDFTTPVINMDSDDDVIDNKIKIKIKCDDQEFEYESESEPDGKYDTNDVISLVGSNCDGIMEEFEIEGLGLWKENKYGMRSFNEVELKEDECKHEGMVYNLSIDDCQDIIYE